MSRLWTSLSAVSMSVSAAPELLISGSLISGTLGSETSGLVLSGSSDSPKASGFTVSGFDLLISGTLGSEISDSLDLSDNGAGSPSTGSGADISMTSIWLFKSAKSDCHFASSSDSSWPNRAAAVFIWPSSCVLRADCALSDFLRAFISRSYWERSGGGAGRS